MFILVCELKLGSAFSCLFFVRIVPVTVYLLLVFAIVFSFL